VGLVAHPGAAGLAAWSWGAQCRAAAGHLCCEQAGVAGARRWSARGFEPEGTSQLFSDAGCAAPARQSDICRKGRERGGCGVLAAGGRKSDVLCKKSSAGRSSRKPELIAVLPPEGAAP